MSWPSQCTVGGSATLRATSHKGTPAVGEMVLKPKELFRFTAFLMCERRLRILIPISRRVKWAEPSTAHSVGPDRRLFSIYVYKTIPILRKSSTIYST